MLSCPKMIMICGSGKNVGKTTLSMLIIKYYAEKNISVYAIKTSRHIHQLDKDEVIFYSEHGADIVKETRKNNKDSSLMLSSGAKESYFIQANEDKMEYAFNYVMSTIPDKSIIICESASLRDFVKPGLFLFVTGKEQSKNLELKSKADFILEFGFDFTVNKLVRKLPLDQF